MSGKLKHYATGCFVAFVGVFLLKLGKKSSKELLGYELTLGW